MCHERLLSLSIVLLMISCQTAPESKSHKENELNLSEEGSLPSSDLWSPEQRKANANYYYLLAEDRVMAQDSQKALKLYELAYSLDPNSFLAAKLVSAKAYIKPEEAFNDIQRMVLLYPKDPEINMLLGQFYLAKGKLQTAIKQFHRVLDLDGERSDAYIGLIQAHRATGEEEVAILLAEKMVKVEPNYANGWAMLAKMYLGKKNSKKALRSAKRAYQLQSNNPEYMHLYAIALELNGESQKAVKLYETIFRSNPNNEELIAKMVGLYKQIGSLEDALALLEEVKSSSKHTKLQISLQIVFINWELKRYTKASALLQVIYKDNPSNSRVAYMAALGAEKLKDYDRALKIYQSIDSKSQFRIHSDFRMVLIFRKNKDYDNAIKVASKVTKSQHERAPDFYILLANIHDDKGRVDDSIKTLKSAAKSFPERTDILFLLGVKQEKAGKTEDCIKTMRQLISIDTQHAGAHNYLGYIYAEQGNNLDEAEKLILRALDLKPNDGYYMDSLGWVYYQKKEYQKALDQLIKADKFAPGEGVILEHIGDVYKAMNQIDKARGYYEKATKSRVDERDRERIFGKFQSLKGKTS